MTKKDHWISARGCVYNVNYHFVWSTKYRRKVLVGNVANDLHMLHELIAQKKGVTLVTQEIMPDHVHLFVTAHPKFSPANIVKIFKESRQRSSLNNIQKSKVISATAIYGTLRTTWEHVATPPKM